MYGILLESIQHFIQQEYDDHKNHSDDDDSDNVSSVWRKVLEAAGLHQDTVFTTHHQYPDHYMTNIAQAVPEVLPQHFPTVDESMRYFGQCFVKFCRTFDYDKILRVAGRHYRDFLHGIDYLHETIHFSYPRMQSPSFLVQEEDKDGCVLVYRSFRRGFAHYVIGQLKQCALSLYKVEVDIKVVEQQETQAGCQVKYRLDFNNAAYTPPHLPSLTVTSPAKCLPKVPGSTFLQLFPFCILFDKDFIVRRVGSGVAKLLGSRCRQGTAMKSVFVLRRPLVEFTWDNILRQQDKVAFELEVDIEKTRDPEKQTETSRPLSSPFPSPLPPSLPSPQPPPLPRFGEGIPSHYRRTCPFASTSSPSTHTSPSTPPTANNSMDLAATLFCPFTGCVMRARKSLADEIPREKRATSARDRDDSDSKEQTTGRERTLAKVKEDEVMGHWSQSGIIEGGSGSLSVTQSLLNGNVERATFVEEEHQKMDIQAQTMDDTYHLNGEKRQEDWDHKIQKEQMYQKGQKFHRDQTCQKGQMSQKHETCQKGQTFQNDQTCQKGQTFQNDKCQKGQTFQNDQTCQKGQTIQNDKCQKGQTFQNDQTCQKDQLPEGQEAEAEMKRPGQWEEGSTTTKALLKGQMKFIPEWDLLAFIFTPLISNLRELRELHMYLNDLNMYDNSRDLVCHGFKSASVLEACTERVVETYGEIQENMKALDRERGERFKLLRTMLPETVARRLINGENPLDTCQSYEAVTILFNSLVGFEDIIGTCKVYDVVLVVNHYQTIFDPIVEKYNLLKVETSGNAVYMVAGGVTGDGKDHAERMAGLALDFLEEVHKVKSIVEGKNFTVRIGMHTGSAASGSITDLKPQFCMFGDTVNTAARLQTSGLPGRIHLSEPCHNLLKKTQFVSIYRGMIQVKGKGDMKSYWLAGRQGQPSTQANVKLFRAERAHTQTADRMNKIPTVIQNIFHTANHS